MELSTSLNALFDPGRVTQERAMERVAASGFRVLDFNFCDWLFEGSPFVGKEWGQWVKDLRNGADRLGVCFSQAHGPIFNKFEDSDHARWLTEMSHRSLESAALLGIPWVVFEPEALPGAYDGGHLSQTKQRNLDWFGGLLCTAEKVRVGIAVENCCDCSASVRKASRWYGSVPVELIDLVDTLDHRLVGICWDTGHAHIQGLDQRAALISLGKRLKATHIQDNNGREDQHLVPFYGTIEWGPIMDALQAIEYEGDFTYEVHNFIRQLPDSLRDSALRYAVEVGKHLMSMVGGDGGSHCQTRANVYRDGKFGRGK